jgi:hypothetical protein
MEAVGVGSIFELATYTHVLVTTVDPRLGFRGPKQAYSSPGERRIRRRAAASPAAGDRRRTSAPSARRAARGAPHAHPGRPQRPHVCRAPARRDGNRARRAGGGRRGREGRARCSNPDRARPRRSCRSRAARES